MSKPFAGGVWPVMLTPYTQDNKVDYCALEELVEWYIENGVHGLFSVCQSSEMFFLTKAEQLEIARFVKEKAAGRVQVIASGHIEDTIAEQAEGIKKMAATGVDAVILITNRLAAEDESDAVWKANLDELLAMIPDNIPLGFYECPYPYKRLISPELLQHCVDTGRFYFLKDTSCDMDNLKAKQQIAQGTNLKIYNANSATLLESLKIGVEGYSGVMANFHPQLYVWLLENWQTKPEKAAELMDVLSILSLIEKQVYPINAKHYLKMEGLAMEPVSRNPNTGNFNITNFAEIEQFYRYSTTLIEKYMDKNK